MRSRFALLAASIVWLTLITRAGIDIVHSVDGGMGAYPGVIKFITAFTTLTNILVAVVLTASTSKSKHSFLRFFSKPTILACTAAYITAMACVWKVMLAPSFVDGFEMLVTSVNLERMVGVFLHGINPALYLFHWLFIAPKRKLRWRDALIWPVGAVAYFAIILIRGTFTDSYPYPFVDVGAIGLIRVLTNAAILLAVFVGFGMAFVALDRWAPESFQH